MNKSLLISALLLGMVATAGTVQARPAHGDHGGFHHGPMGGPPEIGRVLHLAGRLERVAEEIGLSEEQRDAIHAVVDQARPQLRDLGRELRGNRDALRDASAPDSYDAAAVESLAVTQGELIAQAIVLGAQVRHDVLALLTPEQRERLEAMRAERRGFRR